MSELQQVADSVRSLNKSTPNYMRATQEAAQSLRQAISLAASTSQGKRELVGRLQGTGKIFESLMSNIAVFSTGAEKFADELAKGSSSAASQTGDSVVMVGSHGALREAGSDGTSAVTRVDPETGNELVWTQDSSGRTIGVHGKLVALSKEGRTGAESRTTSAIGHLTRDTYNQFTGLGNDDGGHLIAAILAGSHGDINLVPQNFNFNRGAYLQMEKGIRKDLDEGCHVEMSVSLTYSNDSTKRPDTFQVDLEITDEFGNTDYKSFNFYNAYKGVQPNE